MIRILFKRTYVKDMLRHPCHNIKCIIRV